MKWEKVNATIPKETKPDDVTMEMAAKLIEEREEKTGKKKPRAKAKPKAKAKTKKKST